MWIIWLVIAALLLAGEVMTTGFFLLWFGVGAAVAGLAALIGISSLPAQMLIFLAVSILLLIGSRTIFENYLTRRSSLKTGVDRMIGQTGIVVEASHGARQEGAVKMYGSVWTALPVEGEAPLEEGESVAVERMDGNTIYVRRELRPRPLFSKSLE